MIYCVRFSEVEAHLNSLGYFFKAKTAENRLYLRQNGDLITIREPNVFGQIPEILVNEAFDTAGLAVPRWDVRWCD